MKYLQRPVNDRLTLPADGTGELRWHDDVAFAVHPDFRSHTGAVMSMGHGAVISISWIQGQNTRMSTEAELVAAGCGVYAMDKVVLRRSRVPNYRTYNALFQDNRGAILLEKNGRKSASKRSRLKNIQMFFVADQGQKGQHFHNVFPN
jgi:hypothetical protein